MEYLADGGTLDNTPFTFRVRVTRMLFWSCLEAPIEETHARLSRVVSKQSRYSGPLLALALRLPQWRRRIEREPGLMQKLVQHFSELYGRGPLWMLETLHLDQHPQVQDALYLRDAAGGTKHLRIDTGLAKDIIYHCDAESQFYDHSNAMAHAKQQVEERKKQFKQAVQQSIRDGLVPRVAPQIRLTLNVGDSPRIIMDKVSKTKTDA